jgi:Putative zincin peptidase
MILYILSYATFPGVITHEFAHAWACRRMGVRVIKVCYLRLGNPPGYVLHGRPATALQHIVIATAPLFISTFLALIISCAVGVYFVSHAAVDYQDVILVISLWLSFAFALHAFPSSGDADALWSDVKSPKISLAAKLLLVPVVGLIRLAGFGRRFWFDVLFAAVVTLAPFLFVMKALE